MITTLAKIAAVFPIVAFIATLAIVSARQVSAQGAPSRTEQIPYSPTLQPDSGQTMTYFEFPFQRLKEVVPALKGLKYDASQEQLDSILTQVAKTIANVLPRLPDLVSRESISGFQVPGSLSTAGGLANSQPWNRQFRYVILCHHTPDGTTTIEELRTDSKGHRRSNPCSDHDAAKRASPHHSDRRSWRS